MERRLRLASRVLHGLENGIGSIAVLAMAVVPIAEMLGRRCLGQGIPGSITWVQHLTLWVAFAGGIVAARDRRHLALATTTFLSPALRTYADLVASAVTCSVAAVLAWAAWHSVDNERQSAVVLSGGVAVWVVYTIMPVGFALIAIRTWWQSGQTPPRRELEPEAAPYGPAVAWTRRAIVLAAVLAAFSLGSVPDASVAAWRWPLVAAIIGAAVLGAPIFVLLGGLAVVLFYAEAGPMMSVRSAVGAVPSATLQITSQDTLPTLPLFTLAGTLLARGGTPERLVRVFRALAGWLPGGTAVATVLVCAFFTTFTGASGVTILALGSLLLPVLMKDRCPLSCSSACSAASHPR